MSESTRSLPSAESGADGEFQLAVNGGGTLCFEYEKQGYLSACRMVNVGWQDYAWLPEVCLIEAAETTTQVSLKADAPLQIAQGESVKDEHGERKAAVLFPAGTTASLVMRDGTTRPVESLTVPRNRVHRRKERHSCHASPASGQQCLHLCGRVRRRRSNRRRRRRRAIHEARLSLRRELSQFPGGDPRSVGLLRQRQGRTGSPPRAAGSFRFWKSTTAWPIWTSKEKATRQPAKHLPTWALPTTSGSSSPPTYKPGQSLWRMPISHFSIWDLNWGFSPPDDATGPDGDAEDDDHDNHGPTDCGSIIDVHNQILGEALHSRAALPTGCTTTVIACPVAKRHDPCYPADRSRKSRSSRARSKLEVFVAGRHFQKDDFPAEPNQYTTWVWDGKDGFGNEVRGAQQATVRIAYVYKGVYENVSQFGSAGRGIPISGSRTRQEVEMLQETARRWRLGRGLGGPRWLDARRASHLRPRRTDLYLGNGRRRSGLGTKGKSFFNQGIETIAGGGKDANRATANSATANWATVDRPPLRVSNRRWSLRARDRADRYPLMPTGLAVAPTEPFLSPTKTGGSEKSLATELFRPSPGAARPIRSSRDRQVMQSSTDWQVAVGPDGSLYVAMPFTHRVLKVNPQGVISNFAGTGGAGYDGDDGPATAAKLQFATGVSVGPDGSVFIADQYNHRIRRVWPNGTITTVAGTGKQGSKGDGGSALLAELYWPTSLAIANDGSLYFSDQGNYVVRRISPAGVITTVAGTRLEDYEGTFEGDGGSGAGRKAERPDVTGVRRWRRAVHRRHKKPSHSPRRSRRHDQHVCRHGGERRCDGRFRGRWWSGI